MKCNFISSFIPTPTIREGRNQPHSIYKLKIYNSDDKIDSLIDEFEKLYTYKYTHVSNMPGKIEDILHIASEYGIVCIDGRTNKFIADFCSRQIK